MPLTEVEKAYLAGIIDGEGCIMLQRSTARSSAAYVFPVVKIANTSSDLVVWLRSKIEYGAWQYRSKMHEGCKDVHHWCVASNQAIDLLESVRPYLVIKARQADVVSAVWAENQAALAQHGRPFGNGHPLPVWLRHFRDACYWYVRDLNRRGPGPNRYGKQVLSHLASMGAAVAP